MNYKDKFFHFFTENCQISGDVINVQTFLNHQIQVEPLNLIVNFFKKELKDIEFDKILTVESSGIAFASVLGYELKKPVVFAKKKKPITMNDFYSAKSYSFTKRTETTLYIAKEVLAEGEKLIFLDDFYAHGSTFESIKGICDNAKCQIVKVCVIVNKSKNENVVSLIDRSDIEKIRKIKEDC